MADSETITGDSLVWKVQNWLNQTYEGRTGYIKIDRDGITGWGTINALLRAFQIELGINNTSTNFGPTTTANFNSRFPNGIQQQSDDDQTEDNIYAIIKGACWCKGYSTGVFDTEITRRFDSGIGNAISTLKSDAGCSETSSTVTLNVMKALLSMNQFKLTILYGGIEKIRTIQKRINNKYESYLGLIPCDGVYSRQMNTGLIKILQIIEGSTGNSVDGVFGNGTKSKIPLLPQGMFANGVNMNAAAKEESISLLRYALCCNGYTSVDVVSKSWDTELENIIKEFQGDMILDTNGKADVNTWMALLLSRGNREREYNAVDTGYRIYEDYYAESAVDRRQILLNNNINVVGRYITGEQGKQLRMEEAQALLDRGIKIYPIFQEDGTPSVSYFTKEQAELDAQKAYKKAKKYCLPKDTIIYFAVDVDMVDSEVKAYAVPYFKTLKEKLEDYKIGVYGTRNVCTQVMDKGYAVTCFVSDASTGYSGNMGFKMPKNWNIDQFDVDVTLSDGFKVDKNIYANRFPVVTELDERHYYEGSIVISSYNRGRAFRYSGREMKVFVKVTDPEGNPIGDNVKVIVSTHTLQDLTDPFCWNGYVDAKADGNVYDLSSGPIKVIDGELVGIDHMIIDDGLDYYLEYTVLRKGEDGKYSESNDIEVKVSVEVYTYGEQ